MDSRELLIRFLTAYWLRPISGIVRATQADFLQLWRFRESDRLCDLGVGDGVFSSLAVGHDVSDLDPYADLSKSRLDALKDLDGRSDNFLYTRHMEEVEQLRKFGHIRSGGSPWLLGIDHKVELLSKASQTRAFELLRVGNFNADDCGLPKDQKFGVVFSNCLYWAREPARVLYKVSTHQSPGDALLLVVATPNYQKSLLATQFPQWRVARQLDAGRSQHISTLWPSSKWTDVVGAAGYEITRTAECVGPELAFAGEWSDLREFFVYAAELARWAPRTVVDEVKSRWVEDIVHLTDAARDDGLLDCPEGRGAYFMLEARRTA